jgi:hypothetical protein
MPRAIGPPQRIVRRREEKGDDVSCVPPPSGKSGSLHLSDLRPVFGLGDDGRLLNWDKVDMHGESMSRG